MRVFFIILAFFVLPCDPLLRNNASEVPIGLIVSDEVQSIIEKMMEIVGNYREGRGSEVMVGLAAP